MATDNNKPEEQKVSNPPNPEEKNGSDPQKPEGKNGSDPQKVDGKKVSGIQKPVKKTKEKKEYSVFDKISWIKQQAEKGRTFAINCYLRYTELFSPDDRKILAVFESLYLDKKEGMKALEQFNDTALAVIFRFIAFSQWLPCCRFWGGIRNFFSRRMSRSDYSKKLRESLDGKLGKTSSKEAAPAKKTRKDFKSEQEFLDNRYFDQQQYFSRTSGEYKKTYYRLQKWIQALSLSVSVVSLIFIFLGNVIWSGKDEVIPKWFGNLDNFIVAVVSAIAAYLSSNEKLCRNLEFWLKFRTSSERLKTEYALYQGRCGCYNVKDVKLDDKGNTRATKIFRAKVEEIVQNANDSFERILQGDLAPFNGKPPVSPSGDDSNKSNEKDEQKGADNKKNNDSNINVQNAAENYGDTLAKGGAGAVNSAINSISEEKARREEDERKRKEEAEKKKKEEEEKKQKEEEAKLKAEAQQNASGGNNENPAAS